MVTLQILIISLCKIEGNAKFQLEASKNKRIFSQTNSWSPNSISESCGVPGLQVNTDMPEDLGGSHGFRTVSTQGTPGFVPPAQTSPQFRLAHPTPTEYPTGILNLTP